MSNSTLKPMKKTVSGEAVEEACRRENSTGQILPFQGGRGQNPYRNPPPTLRNPNRRKPLRIISSGSGNWIGAQSAVPGLGAAATEVITTAHV